MIDNDVLNKDFIKEKLISLKSNIMSKNFTKCLSFKLNTTFHLHFHLTLTRLKMSFRMLNENIENMEKN